MKTSLEDSERLPHRCVCDAAEVPHLCVGAQDELPARCILCNSTEVSARRAISQILPTVDMLKGHSRGLPKFHAYFCDRHAPKLRRVVVPLLLGDLGCLVLLLLAVWLAGAMGRFGLLGLLLVMHLVLIGFILLAASCLRELRQPAPLRIAGVDAVRRLHVRGVDERFLKSLSDRSAPGGGVQAWGSDPALIEAFAELGRLEYAEDFDEGFYQLYVAAGDLQRSELRSLWTDRERLSRPRRFRNADTPCRMDVHTVEQLRRYATFGVMASSDDRRGALLEIAWYYHTANLLGLDAERFLNELEGLASPSMQSAIGDFLQRGEGGRRMPLWGLHVAESGQGKYIEFRG